MSTTFDQLTLQNDFLFKRVMQNKRICKKLIETILDIQIASISFPEIEKTLDIATESKGIRLDIIVEDDQHTRYNLEMQALNTINQETQESLLPKRTRYYQAMLDTDMLQKGQDYDSLYRTYIIFICGFDLFEKGLYTYTFTKRCHEDLSLELPDETTIVFLNAKGTHGPASDILKSFLRYVDDHIVTDEFTQELQDELLHVKNDPKARRDYMKYEMNIKDIRNEALQIGLKQGEQIGIDKGITIGMDKGITIGMDKGIIIGMDKGIIIGMLQAGATYDTIAKATKASYDTIEEIAKEYHIP